MSISHPPAALAVAERGGSHSVTRSSRSELTGLPALRLARLIRQKQCSPVEVIDAYLNRIEKLNPGINAFASVAGEAVRAEAKRAEAAVMAGEDSKPLLGVPLSIKSCIDVQGIRCEAGSILRAGYVAREDATLVSRLKAGGAIILGVTNAPEGLIAYHTENELVGRTSNPWDLTRTPGGSSGGEAAAIASGMSAGGIGSDGGGSIRVPSHFCGICGLKPTPGRIPTTGHYPPCGGPFSLIGVVGPMARTVDDLRVLLEITAGYDSSDPVSLPLDDRPPLTGFHPGKMRVGFYEDDGFCPATPEIRAAIHLAASALAQEGLEVETFRPDGLGRARELWFTIFVEAIAMVMAPGIQGHDHEISPSTLDFMAFAHEQPPLTAERLLNTLLERDALRSRLLIQMEKFPILLAPVCAVPAFPHSDGGWGSAHAVDYAKTMSYSQHYNLLGNPAAVVPVARTAEGLPIGVQVIGRPYREDEVLAVARMLESRVGTGVEPAL